MLPNEPFNPDWARFVEEFAIIESFYRQGTFEKKLNVEVVEVAPDEPAAAPSIRQTGDDLQTKADELFRTARRAWETGRVPFEHFPKILRSLTTSFEIDEYFLCLEDDKKSFFREFLDDFLKRGSSLEKEELLTEIRHHAERIEGFPADDAEALVALGYELILFCCCGLNVKYVAHSFRSYGEGLADAETLLVYIEKLIEYKTETAGKGTGRGLGLRAFTFFFKARFAFGLGMFKDARRWFKKSRRLYLEKAHRLIDGADERQIEARKLALRRACLVDVIGLANLYLIESRIDKAREILARTAPLLELGTGDVMRAYGDLLRVSVGRAKYSGDRARLDALEGKAEVCLEIFSRHVGHSHFPHKAGIELALIHMYQAKSLPKDDLAGREALSEKARERLDRAIEYADQVQKGELKNGRMLIEALTLRSHLYRSYADFRENEFERYLGLAADDARRARDLADGLKQLQSDAYIALGIAYRDLFLRAEPRSDAEKKYKIKANQYFTDALWLNSENNARISSVCYLRMSELEMIKTTYFARAKYLFANYLRIEKKVGHFYVRQFGRDLERTLRSFSHHAMFDFVVDLDETLEFSKWRDRLRDFLIEQTVFRTAAELRGEMPKRRRRGEMPRGPETADALALRPLDPLGREFIEPLLAKKAPEKFKKNATLQSVLADALKEKVGLPQNEAYKEADKHLDEFERWCRVISAAER